MSSGPEEHGDIEAGDQSIESESSRVPDAPLPRSSGPSRNVLQAVGALPSPTEPDVTTRMPWLQIAGAALVVVAAWALFALWNLGSMPFHTKGEPREALVVWEMTHGGSWILPHRNGSELPSKPPLFHWLAALVATVRGGLDEWSARSPSAFASLLGGLGVLLAGTRLWSVRAGLIAALVLFSSIEWGRAATTARVDMVLALGLELSFLSLLFFLRTRNWRWLVPLYLGISLSVLGKGPIGVVLPGLVALFACILSRDVTPLQQMRLLRGAVAVAVLGGSWYLLAYREGGYDFFYKQVLDENVFRFVGAAELSGGHRHSALWLYTLMFLAMLPWTLVIPSLAARIWSERSNLRAQDGIGFLLLWIVVVASFYAIPASKRTVYLLPIYPAVALLIGWWLDDAIRQRRPDIWLGRVLRVVMPPATIIAILAAIAIVGTVVGLPIDTWLAEVLNPREAQHAGGIAASLRARAPVALAATALLLGSAALLLTLGRRPDAGKAIAGLLAVAIAGSVLTRQVVLPGIAAVDTQREFMGSLRQHIEPGHALFFYRTINYGAVYYWDRHIPVYKGTWPAGGPRYVLKSVRAWERERSSAVHHYEAARGADGRKLESTRLVLLERRTQPSE